jgi:MATH domain.
MIKFQKSSIADSVRHVILTLSLLVSPSGTLIWKITDYSLKCQESIELLSPSFYTSQFGYKLQVSLFLNGNGAGEGTHVSVYIKLLPGEYDALLKWPFSHSVSFTLFDQSEKVSEHLFI